MTRKPAYAAFWAVLLLALTACQTLGIGPADTFNKRLAAGYTTVTSIRDLTGTLLSNGTITVKDAVSIQTQADALRVGLDAARTLHATDPNAANSALTVAINGLTSLQSFLQSKKP